MKATEGVFTRQVERITEYHRRINRVVGLCEDEMCYPCVKKRREIMLTLGDYGCEVILDVVGVLLEEGSVSKNHREPIPEEEQQ